MCTSERHLVRKAFLTKYGYAPDLTYPEIVREFQRRYDHAQTLRLQNAGAHQIMLVIEGMDESSPKEEARLQREARKLTIGRLTLESDYGISELEQLIEGFAQRLEVNWIQSI